MYAKAFALAGLASVASAHMVISNPIPYGQASLNNSPLDASGSDYPCKLRSGTYDTSAGVNTYAAGSSQKLSFKGTAVHGGGSCQISISTDTEPNAKSVFKVIKSIEGGCPAKGQTGNMGDSADAVDPYTYDYTIPKDLAAGNYTLAWTWFNKVGNREMYMNCAPLVVTGSGGSSSALESLPEIFKANIGNGCTTESDTDVVFPNAGSDVDQFNGDTTAWYTPPATCAGAAGSASTPAAGGGSGYTTTAAAVATSSPAASYGNGGGAASTVPGGVFITVSQPAATAAPATTAAPAATTPAAAVPSSGSGSGSGSGSSSEYAAGTACTNEGEWNCVGGSSFQRCASGAWTAVQALSSGVTCTSGTSSELALSAKRGIINLRRALRMRQ